MSAAVGCCATVVAGSNGFRTIYKPCTRAGKVERDGKWYCAQHDPQAQADRREKKREQWAIENAESARKRRLVDAAPELLRVCEMIDSAATQNEVWRAMSAARAAIARAKGETT